MPQPTNSVVALTEKGPNSSGGVNSPSQVLFASLIGTTIEFFDFYIYATAAVLVFPKLFFPASDPASRDAGIARYVCDCVFRAPCRARRSSVISGTVLAARRRWLRHCLLCGESSTVAIGTLPSYHTIGIVAPLFLAALCRFGQGLGLGGEWGGAVLLAIENAPPGKRAWYGMFPQLGAPVGFLFSGGVFLALSKWLTDEQFFAFGWRIPFLASGALVLVGLYVRLTISETPVFRDALSRREPVQSADAGHSVLGPLLGRCCAGILSSLATFVLFYLMTVFALSWGTTALGYSRSKFLVMQLAGILFFAATIPISAVWAEGGRRRTLLRVTAAIGAFGLVMAPLFRAGTTGAVMTDGESAHR